jgi:ferredoxin
MQEILASLKDCTKIFLIGCGNCATTCKSGGQDQLKAMQQQLLAQGKEVLGYCIPETVCVAAKLKTELAKNMNLLRQAEAILIFACGSGIQSVKDADRFNLSIMPGCNTIFGAVVDGQGNFFEKCSLCGECVLGITAGICPTTLCPKSLLNGPCGGMNKGKCELDSNRDCAWALIYKELEKKNKLDTLKKIQKPRDFKKNLRPHSLVVNK